MSATYTESQLVNFYQQWEPKVQYFGIEIIPSGYFKFFKQGREILKARAATKAAEAKAKSRATRWTAEEYDAMAAAYFKHGRNQKACLAEFRTHSDRHTDKSVMLAVYSCAALDTKVNEITGLKDYAQGLLNALNAIEAGRFKGTR